MQINIHASQVKIDSKLAELAEEKLQKLQKFFENIISIDVFFILEGKSSQIKDKVVEIKMNIPGHTLFAKDSSKLFEEALDQVIGDIKRQIKRVKEKMRKS